HLDDDGVSASGQGAGLIEEAPDDLGILGSGGMDQLDGDPALDDGMDGLIDHPHPALSDISLQAVGADHGPYPDGGGKSGVLESSSILLTEAIALWVEGIAHRAAWHQRFPSKVEKFLPLPYATKIPQKRNTSFSSPHKSW